VDANGQRFWQLADAADFVAREATPQTSWAGGSLRLASRMGALAAVEDQAAAVTRLERVPATRDELGGFARYDAGTRQVMASGAFPDEVAIGSAPAGKEPTDLVLGLDGVLYMALEGSGEVAISDRRARWPDQVVAAPAGFRPWRLAAHPDGGVWALDRQQGKLARLHGLPLRVRPFEAFDPDVFRPRDENRDPPRVDVLDLALPAGETAVALATDPDGRLALLSWSAPGPLLRFLEDERRLSDPMRLDRVVHPYALGWVEDGRIAVLVAGWAEAAVYDVGTPAAVLEPVGDFYPLVDHDGGALVHGPDLPVSYATASGPRPLLHASLPAFEQDGEVTAARVIDSFDAQTVWHRLYLEVALPPHTGIVVSLAAADTPDAALTDADFFPHCFGDVAPPSAGAEGATTAPALAAAAGPRGAWLREASEIPFHPGFLACERRPGQAGLFTALVQRAGLHGRRVRALRGRYLFVRVALSGDRRSTPELAALRVYGSRFSYRDRYLPELYGESLFAPEADGEGDATPADFLDRFLAAFEGVLTSIEDRVRFSWLLTDPRSAPDEALPWLASFVGLSFDPVISVERRRLLLASAPELYRRRGTLGGIALAIDLATGGLCASGQVVVFEDWRLRRTFATILGASFDDQEDPLLMTIGSSGNSYVGDTLFLGDENNKEFLAIFAADLPETAAERAAVDQLFERLAHRMTLFVHRRLDPDTQSLLQRVADLEKPAHVQVRLLQASENFVVGLASLLGVQTFVDVARPPQPVTVDQTRLGLEGYLVEPPSLDPRQGGKPASS
jgi:phage tail-like protein